MNVVSAPRHLLPGGYSGAGNERVWPPVACWPELPELPPCGGSRASGSGQPNRYFCLARGPSTPSHGRTTHGGTVPHNRHNPTNECRYEDGIGEERKRLR